ncbi:MAG TPA: DivIVA domain-containing protein, partial [Acidimicrobiales bacterium]|nr:DivIVA domain-containing protein [Acidimicrobiales bacterium]
MSDQLPAEVVARKDFPLSFRGFDQQEVRAHLERLAREIEGLRAREADLLGRIAALEDEATREPDEAMLEKALGQEATRVLHVAREGAAAIRAKAEEDAAAARAEAASMVDASRDDAEQRAAKIVDEARARADAMLADATAGRDRVLADIDRLRVARDRLAASFEEVRRALEIGEA